MQALLAHVGQFQPWFWTQNCVRIRFPFKYLWNGYNNCVFLIWKTGAVGEMGPVKGLNRIYFKLSLVPEAWILNLMQRKETLFSAAISSEGRNNTCLYSPSECNYLLPSTVHIGNNTCLCVTCKLFYLMHQVCGQLYNNGYTPACFFTRLKCRYHHQYQLQWKGERNLVNDT